MSHVFNVEGLLNLVCALDLSLVRVLNLVCALNLVAEQLCVCTHTHTPLFRTLESMKIPVYWAAYLFRRYVCTLLRCSLFNNIYTTQ